MGGSGDTSRKPAHVVRPAIKFTGKLQPPSLPGGSWAPVVGRAYAYMPVVYSYVSLLRPGALRARPGTVYSLSKRTIMTMSLSVICVPFLLRLEHAVDVRLMRLKKSLKTGPNPNRSSL